MPIPREILDVPRPKNTVVIVYGKNKNLYGVRQRIGCRNVNGRHLPVNGPTIGHIIQGKYVPIEENDGANVSEYHPDLKDWANVALCDQIFQDIIPDLKNVYSHKDAMKIYCITILRVCNPGIKDCELKKAFDESFLSELYPNVALSKNTVSSFLGDLGRAYSKIVQFMRSRTAKVPMDHHLLVDGTLKSDESEVNSLSNFSRKAKIKGTRDISILYAYDLEAMEPICSKCFPGNMLDATAYGEFIDENKITKGIIVADKGFPESAAHEHFEKNPDLHYLNPIKRNSKFISRHHMLDYTGILSDQEDIVYRKEKCIGTNKWLYSYRDSKKAAKEESDWLKRTKKKGTYSLEAYKKKQQVFGTIVLESDLDLPAETIYKTYSSRWQIEIVMRYYKTACEFNETRVHDDYSVIGSEFCDFLSTVLTFRLLKKFDSVKLFEQKTYKNILDILTRAKKIKWDDDEWRTIRLNRSEEEMLQKLGLIPVPEKPPKRKPGRPKGSKNKSKTKSK